MNEELNDQPAPLPIDFDIQQDRVQQARRHLDSISRDPDDVVDRAASFVELSDQRSAMDEERRAALRPSGLRDDVAASPDDDADLGLDANLEPATSQYRAAPQRTYAEAIQNPPWWKDASVWMMVLVAVGALTVIALMVTAILS